MSDKNKKSDKSKYESTKSKLEHKIINKTVSEIFELNKKKPNA